MRVIPEWEVEQTFGTVVLECAPAEDERGRIWPAMAYRVVSGGKVVRTFVGETAWSDAEREALDIALAARYR